MVAKMPSVENLEENSPLRVTSGLGLTRGFAYWMRYLGQRGGNTCTGMAAAMDQSWMGGSGPRTCCEVRHVLPKIYSSGPGFREQHGKLSTASGPMPAIKRCPVEGYFDVRET